LFDQGWFGVFTWSALVVLALSQGIRQAVHGSGFAMASSCALVGFLVSGSLNTLIDAPRFLFLFLLLIWFACTSKPVVKSVD